MPRLWPKRKLLAATRRATGEEYAEEEPNVKLSSAFAVVLILHIVAVGGIYAFNSIKAHRPSSAEATPPQQQAPPKPEGEDRQADTSSGGSAVTPAANVSTVAMKTYRVKSGDTLTKIALVNGVSAEELEEVNGLKNVGALRVGQEIKIPAKPATKPIGGDSHKAPDVKKPADASAMPKDSGETYTVAKGDNPVAIAKKLHVSYDELLKLNKIDDPKKLQIGQKLKIPAKRTNN